MTELRIHHFFDIIRDYGAGKTLCEHDYRHSYHLIGNEIYANRIDSIRLIVKNDDICRNCIMLRDGSCIDTITHRTDFTSKESFNNHLDKRIMERLGYTEGQVVPVTELIKNSYKYLYYIFSDLRGKRSGSYRKKKAECLFPASRRRRWNWEFKNPPIEAL